MKQHVISVTSPLPASLFTVLHPLFRATSSMNTDVRRAWNHSAPIHVCKIKEVKNGQRV